VNKSSKTGHEPSAENSSDPTPTSDGPKAIQSLADLLPDDRNVNRHTERGTGALETSLRQFGAGRSIVVDRNGKTICGNATLEGAASIGLDKVHVVPTDGNTLVVVQRTDLDLDTDPRARGLAIADNRVAELNIDLDPAVLAAQLEEFGLNAIDVGYVPEELERLISEQAAGGENGGAASPPNLDPGEGRYKAQFGVIILCASEAEQEREYNEAKANGKNCRVVVT
jgi:hypothetical protein